LFEVQSSVDEQIDLQQVVTLAKKIRNEFILYFRSE